MLLRAIPLMYAPACFRFEMVALRSFETTLFESTFVLTFTEITQGYLLNQFERQCEDAGELPHRFHVFL